MQIAITRYFISYFLICFSGNYEQEFSSDNWTNIFKIYFRTGFFVIIFVRLTKQISYTGILKQDNYLFLFYQNIKMSIFIVLDLIKCAFVKHFWFAWTTKMCYREVLLHKIFIVMYFCSVDRTNILYRNYLTGFFIFNILFVQPNKYLTQEFLNIILIIFLFDQKNKMSIFEFSLDVTCLLIEWNLPL
jgi:hypothetical protein